MDDIAVDIGGTQLRAALYPPEGLDARVSRSIPTAGENAAIERLFDLITSVWPADGAVRRIALGVAGALNPQTGVVYQVPNIPNWNGLNIIELTEKRFNVPVRLGNDANLATLGEWKYGAAIGHHNVIYLTISTGVGGGIIVDDRLLLGHNGLGAEVGHITVLPGGPICGCGHPGHLESMSSGTGIANHVIRQVQAGRKTILANGNELPTARLVAEAARQGDELALEAFTIAGEFLGRAIADLLHIFNPTIVILGGGVIKSGELIMSPVRCSLEQTVVSSQYLEDFQLTTAKLGDRVGLIGALALARE
ncbi:MAG TPA: ROK family protein [Anaerolineaceae bacterium]|nr:ROK family protein [Anaerolineaceae bacterium]